MKSKIVLALIFYLIFLNENPVFAQPWLKWNELEKEIRDGCITYNSAKEQIRQLHKQLLKVCREYNFKKANYYFPLEGYSTKDIGGINGSGYKPEGYIFYDGNEHKGHPAHDIFIDDIDQNVLSDKTSLPVNIVSMSNGIVIAVNNNWGKSSDIRGGNYIWIFDLATEGYFYYAHLKDIVVSVGDKINAGQTIGTLGRSGENALQKRSPTHLHLMYLHFNNGNMTPENIFELLCKSIITQ